jgi:hypothetical protein
MDFEMQDAKRNTVDGVAIVIAQLILIGACLVCLVLGFRDASATLRELRQQQAPYVNVAHSPR